MADLRWFAHRLRAMSPGEIAWRLEQKAMQTAEAVRFRKKRAVTASPFYRGSTGRCAPEKLFLNTGNRIFSLHTSIPIFAPYRYADYRMRWHAGFQTENEWPMVPASRLDYRGMDAVGDARTNWELNKHFQFALLAKDYCASGDRRFLNELTALFDDWNEKNPFLWGISWTSGIEIAERTMNWCYALGFLRAVPDVPEKLLQELATGIGNMAAWLFRHYSRYSSANNHLIVEISAVLHAGILTENDGWINRAVEILTRELFLQNFADGVNKEEALYYQTFMMEAYALDLRLLQKNGIAAKETEKWLPLLQKMARYVRTCIGEHGEIVEFGDNDDGKLLDLTGCEEGGAMDGGVAHYRYLLQFFSLLLPERYDVPERGETNAAVDWCETIRWLFTAKELARAEEKPVFAPTGSADYAEGGNAILRSADREVLVGIDHAPLGYGALCAHGHADALSLVAFVGGRPFLCDPGTYIYHTDEAARDDFRRTARHNTICVGGADQSEMLGAFLWGKRANCTLLLSELSEVRDVIEAAHDGYAPVIHRRKFVFDKVNRILTVEDDVGGARDAVFSLLFAPGVGLTETAANVWRCADADGMTLGTVAFVSGFYRSSVVDREISLIYGVRERTVGLEASLCGTPAVCEIRFGEGCDGGG